MHINLVIKQVYRVWSLMNIIFARPMLYGLVYGQEFAKPGLVVTRPPSLQSLFRHINPESAEQRRAQRRPGREDGGCGAADPSRVEQPQN